MTADLEQWRDKEKMYPEDWEQVIAATNSSFSALFQPHSRLFSVLVGH
nr:hypothetical protein [Candidatus Electrothrix aestuarii]